MLINFYKSMKEKKMFEKIIIKRVEKRNKIKKEIKKTSCDRFHNFVCLKHACEHAYA